MATVCCTGGDFLATVCCTAGHFMATVCCTAGHFLATVCWTGCHFLDTVCCTGGYFLPTVVLALFPSSRQATTSCYKLRGEAGNEVHARPHTYYKCIVLLSGFSHHKLRSLAVAWEVENEAPVDYLQATYCRSSLVPRPCQAFRTASNALRVCKPGYCRPCSLSLVCSFVPLVVRESIARYEANFHRSAML